MQVTGRTVFGAGACRVLAKAFALKAEAFSTAKRDLRLSDECVRFVRHGQRAGAGDPDRHRSDPGGARRARLRHEHI